MVWPNVRAEQRRHRMPHYSGLTGKPRISRRLLQPFIRSSYSAFLVISHAQLVIPPYGLCCCEIFFYVLSPESLRGAEYLECLNLAVLGMPCF